MYINICNMSESPKSCAFEHHFLLFDVYLLGVYRYTPFSESTVPKFSKFNISSHQQGIGLW